MPQKWGWQMPGWQMQHNQIYVHPASCCANRREKTKDEALFGILYLMEVAHGCVCEREKHLFVPDRMFTCPYDMLYNSLIPTIREIETKNHSSQSEQYHE